MFLAIGIWAGLRPSEIAALQWQSVDLDNATIHVRKALKREALEKLNRRASEIVPASGESIGTIMVQLSASWHGLCTVDGGNHQSEWS